MCKRFAGDIVGEGGEGRGFEAGSLRALWEARGAGKLARAWQVSCLLHFLGTAAPHPCPKVHCLSFWALSLTLREQGSAVLKVPVAGDFPCWSLFLSDVWLKKKNSNNLIHFIK